MHHYVYRITNTVLNKHYYGVRSSKNAPLHDIGIKYFSSSKDKSFVQDQRENQQNYKYKIIRNFINRADAVNLEIKLHNKFNVGANESFYNRSKQSSTGWDTTGISFPKSVETRKKLSDSLKGRKLSEYHKKTISKNSKITTPLQWRNYSNKRLSEVKESISNGNKKYYDSLSNGEILEMYKRGLGKWKVNNPEKQREAWDIAAEKRKGPNNGSAKKINIYDDTGNLIFECHGNVQSICNENGMPFNKIKESYLNDGRRLYQSKYGQTIAKKQCTDKYIGWYAKYKEE